MSNQDDKTKSSLTQQEKIDRWADRFETEFQEGGQPSIEAYIEGFHGDRMALLRELLRVEVELRKEAGDTINPESYLRRFPYARAVVESELRDHHRPAIRTVRRDFNSLPVVFGDYRLVSKIGEGGMGIVFEAEQKSLGNRRLALKIIKYTGHPGGSVLRRFRTEVEAVAQLEHRHIVPVYHVGEESGVHFYVMKFIDGDNLRTLVKSLKSAVNRRRASTEVNVKTEQATGDRTNSTHLSGWSKVDTLASNDVIDKVSQDGSTAHPMFLKNLIRMGIQVATALHHVHQQGIVHRDIKPANLLLDRDGDVWLTDFGLAMIRDKPGQTASGVLIGTYQYMSPEQAMGSKRVIVDHRTDIYSLGVTLYELLTLTRPFAGHSRDAILRRVQFENPLSIRKIAPRVPKDLETIVMKAMAKDPNARFQSAAEMAAELQRHWEGKPLTIRPPSVIEKLIYWGRVNRQAAASLAAVFLIAFFASIVTAVVSIRAQAETSRQLTRSEGLRLAANSSLQVDKDPTLALLLAVEAAERHPGADANDAIIEALDKGHEMRVLSGHTAPVGHVAFNQDGTQLVSSATNETFGQVQQAEGKQTELIEPAILWNTATGEALGKLQDTKTITSAVFSPDDALILTASSPTEDKATNNLDETLPTAPPALWDAATHAKVTTFDGAFLFQAHRRAIHPNAPKIVLPINGNKAAVFALSGAKLLELNGHEARVTYAAFDPTGRRVVTSSDDNTVRIWDITEKPDSELLKLDVWRKPGLETQNRDVAWVEFSPDGRRLVTGSKSRGIQLWDLDQNGTLLTTSRVPGTSGTFFGNGDLLATHGGEDYGTMTKLSIQSAYDARWIEDVLINKPLRKVVVSPDNHTAGVLHYTQMNRFEIWDLERHELQATLGAGSTMFNDLSFSPDAKLVATASEDMTVRLWHVYNGRDRATFPTINHSKDQTLAASPDGKTLSITSNEPAAVGVLCDFANSKRVISLDATIAIPSSGGRRLVATQEDRVTIHSMEDGMFVGQETFLLRDAIKTAINPEGDRVAAYTGGTSVMLWTPETNRRQSLPVGNEQLNELRFGPDGRQLFALSSDGRARVWDAQSGELIKVLDNGGQLHKIDFSPDANLFTITTAHGVATLYDAETFEEIRRFSKPGASFDRARFSFDGKKLITFRTTDPQQLLTWDIDSGNQENSLDVDGTLGVAMHPSQPETLIWSKTEGAVIWRYEENERLPITDEPTSCGAYSPDGEHFYLGSWTPAIYEARVLDQWPKRIDSPKLTRWKRDSLQAGESIEFPRESLHEILVSDQDQVFVNSLRHYQVVNYDMATHEQVSVIPGHYGPISGCLCTSDSERLITTSWDGHVSIWSLADGKLIASERVQSSPIVSSAISRDGRDLVTGDRDGSCTIWRLPELTVAETVAVADSPIRHVELDRDAKRFLAISSDNTVHLLGRSTGEVIPFDFHAESIEWAEFSPDGATVLVIPRESGENDESDEVLIVPLDGSTVTRLQYPQSVASAHFHPDSQRIVTAAGDNEKDPTVWIRNARSGVTERKFDHEPVSSLHAVFDPTGDFVYVGGRESGTIWRVSDGRRWLTVEGRTPLSPWHHTHDPFAPGQPRRVIIQRSLTHQFRDLPLEPLEAVRNGLPRALTEQEASRFLIEE